jgi:hypothetical protein
MGPWWSARYGVPRPAKPARHAVTREQLALRGVEGAGGWAER